jgi:hypothetical protein
MAATYIYTLRVSKTPNLPLSFQNFSTTHHHKMPENGSYMDIKASKPFNLSTQQPNTRISTISCWGKRTQTTTSIRIMKEGTKKGPLTENKKQEKNTTTTTTTTTEHL